MSYHNVAIEIPPYLKSFAGLFSGKNLLAFVDSKSGDVRRKSFNGVITVTTQEQPFGLIICDFRIQGGSFGKEESQRVNAFIEDLGRKKIPLFIYLNSLGVRFYEGRTVIDDAFGILAHLYRFKQNNLLVVATEGNCLGICGPIFQCAHYRIKIGEKVLYHLTGPKAHNFFFKEKVDFEEIAEIDAVSQFDYLVHERHSKLEIACEGIARILKKTCGTDEPESGHDLESLIGTGSKTLNLAIKILKATGRCSIELFKGHDDRVMIFLVNRGDQKIGVFLQPPWQPMNMVGFRTLQKYKAALELFAALKVPIISFTDNPGIDPHPYADNTRSVIELVNEVAELIVCYPTTKISVIVGRIFGGGATLGFPKCFGSKLVLAMEGCLMGAMADTVVETLIEGSASLKEKWESVKKTEKPDFSDLIEVGSIDHFIRYDELERYLDIGLS